MATRTPLRLVEGGRRPPSMLLLIAAFALAGGLGGVLLGRLVPAEMLDRLLEPGPVLATAPMTTQSFPLCSGPVRIDCVVDGDTFWLDGSNIRIADINTPEVGSPACAAEATLGQRAKARLRELLSGGPFGLEAIDRDEDVYGRKLRVVVRNGRSIGDTLVSEGLAHHWRGYKESWC